MCKATWINLLRGKHQSTETHFLFPAGAVTDWTLAGTRPVQILHFYIGLTQLRSMWLTWDTYYLVTWSCLHIKLITLCTCILRGVKKADMPHPYLSVISNHNWCYAMALKRCLQNENWCTKFKMAGVRFYKICNTCRIIRVVSCHEFTSISNTSKMPLSK